MKLPCKTWTPKHGHDFLFAHQKLDGNYTIIRNQFAFSSQGTDLTLKLSAFPWFKKWPYTLHGELYLPGHPASDIKTAINEENPELQFRPFAVDDLIATAPIPFVNSWIADLGFEPIPCVQYSPDLIDKPLPRGVEGWVFKNGNRLDWHKWKPVKTIDAVVLDIKDGKGKFIGLVGALFVGVYAPDGTLTEIASVGGFDDETRILFSDESPVGQVIEVAYQYVGAGKRLRHPRFIRVRDDKTPHQCTMEQDDDFAT